MLLCALLPLSAHYFSDVHSALFFHSPPFLLLCSSFCFLHYYPLIIEYSNVYSIFICLFPFFLVYFQNYYYFFSTETLYFFEKERACRGSPGPVGGAVAAALLGSSPADTTWAAEEESNVVERVEGLLANPPFLSFMSRQVLK